MTSSSFSPDLQKSDLKQCGYVPVEVHGYEVVTRDWAASAIVAALAAGTLHEWAAQQSRREEMRGRGIIYSVELATTPVTPVVVRRNRHGGLLHGLTGEYFLRPTRAPFELATSLRLAAAGIPTPEVIAYAVYPAVGIFARSDVMTRRLPMGDDFPAAWQNGTNIDREMILVAAAHLLKSLAHAGAWHADLNLKNIYIAGNGSDLTAYLLDVDRVTFPVGCDIEARNLERLVRSARKWRVRWGLDFDEDSLERLAGYTKESR